MNKEAHTYAICKRPTLDQRHTQTESKEMGTYVHAIGHEKKKPRVAMLTPDKTDLKQRLL